MSAPSQLPFGGVAVCDGKRAVTLYSLVNEMSQMPFGGVAVCDLITLEAVDKKYTAVVSIAFRLSRCLRRQAGGDALFACQRDVSNAFRLSRCLRPDHARGGGQEVHRGRLKCLSAESPFATRHALPEDQHARVHGVSNAFRLSRRLRQDMFLRSLGVAAVGMSQMPFGGVAVCDPKPETESAADDDESQMPFGGVAVCDCHKACCKNCGRLVPSQMPFGGVAVCDRVNDDPLCLKQVVVSNAFRLSRRLRLG